MKSIYSLEEVNLLNKVVFFFHRPYICKNNWDEYIFSDLYKHDRPLRTKSGILLLTSLLDVVSSHNQKINRIREEIRALNLPHAFRYCEQASEFKESILQIFLLYTKEEQILLQDYRNQLVHGYLNGQNEEIIRAKYISDAGEINTEKMTSYEYRLLIKKVHERGLFGDITLDLISRFTDKQLKFWEIMKEYSEIHSILYENINAGKEFDWETISA